MENKNQYEKPNLEHLDVVGKGQGGVCAPNGSNAFGACTPGGKAAGACTTGGTPL